MLVRFVGSEPHSWLRKDCEYVVLAVGAERGSGGHDQLTFMIHHQGDRGAFDWLVVGRSIRGCVAGVAEQLGLPSASQWPFRPHPGCVVSTWALGGSRSK
jgi:hypothetical protein